MYVSPRFLLVPLIPPSWSSLTWHFRLIWSSYYKLISVVSCCQLFSLKSSIDTDLATFAFKWCGQTFIPPPLFCPNLISCRLFMNSDAYASLDLWVCQSLYFVKFLLIHRLNEPPLHSCSSGKAFQLRSTLNQHRLGTSTLTHYRWVLVTHLTTQSKKLATPAPPHPPESSCITEKPTPTWVDNSLESCKPRVLCSAPR